MSYTVLKQGLMVCSGIGRGTRLALQVTPPTRTPSWQRRKNAYPTCSFVPRCVNTQKHKIYNRTLQPMLHSPTTTTGMIQVRDHSGAHHVTAVVYYAVSTSHRCHTAGKSALSASPRPSTTCCCYLDTGCQACGRGVRARPAALQASAACLLCMTAVRPACGSGFLASSRPLRRAAATSTRAAGLRPGGPGSAAGVSGLCLRPCRRVLHFIFHLLGGSMLFMFPCLRSSLSSKGSKFSANNRSELESFEIEIDAVMVCNGGLSKELQGRASKEILWAPYTVLNGGSRVLADFCTTNMIRGPTIESLIRSTAAY